MLLNSEIKPNMHPLKPPCRFSHCLLKHTDIHHELDVFEARSKVFELPQVVGFDTVKQHSVATVITELANNIEQHADGGSIQVELIEYCMDSDFIPHYQTLGIRVYAQDQGPGIVNLTRACSEGFTTGTSLGCGLSGSIRLADQLLLSSSPAGTAVEAFFWADLQHKLTPQLYIEQIASICTKAPQFIAYSAGVLCSDLT